MRARGPGAIRTGAGRDIVLAGAMLALMIYNGAMHAVPMSVAAVGLTESLLAPL